MSSVQTMLVPFSSSGQENGGVKIEVPAQSVDPGEPVRMYLWGASADALAGYTLTQGADGLGAGTLRQYPDQTEAHLFELDGTGGLRAFDWPVVGLMTVVAVGHCFVVDGNDVAVVALPGEDVTRFFRLSGNALAPAVGAPKLVGTVMGTAARSPWCREWRWTAPAKPSAGFPDGTCTDDEDDRDDTAYWFFLLRWGVLAEEFSMSLSVNVSYVVDTGGSDDSGDDDFDYGTVWAQLSWNTLDDLDLWVVDPCENRIWYGRMEQTCDGKTGTLDIDANAAMSSNSTETPVERIAFENPKRGTYVVIVSFYLSHIQGKTVDFSLLIQTGKGLVSLSDSIQFVEGRDKDYKTMLTFTY